MGGSDGEESSGQRGEPREAGADADGPGGAYVNVGPHGEEQQRSGDARAARPAPAEHATPSAGQPPPPSAVGGYLRRAKDVTARAVQWATAQALTGGGGDGPAGGPAPAEPAAPSDDGSSRSAGSGTTRRRDAGPGDENDRWEFMQDDDTIEAADVPEHMRVVICDPRRSERAGDLAEPDLFVVDGEAVRQLDVWSAAAGGVTAGFETLACARALTAIHKDRRGLTARALGDAWKAAVTAMPWLAPVVLPAAPSARFRLLEVALRALLVETEATEPLNPFGDWAGAAPDLAPDVALDDAARQVAVAVFDTAGDTATHAVEGIRNRLREAVRTAEERETFPSTVAGRLQAGWVVATAHVAISDPGDRVVFPAGIISEQLAAQTVAPRLTTCVAWPADESLVLQHVAAVAAMLRNSGVCGDVCERAGLGRDGDAVTWGAVNALVTAMSPPCDGAALAVGDDAPEIERDGTEWLGRPATVDELKSAIDTRAAALIEARRDKHSGREPPRCDVREGGLAKGVQPRAGVPKGPAKTGWQPGRGCPNEPDTISALCGAQGGRRRRGVGGRVRCRRPRVVATAPRG